MVGEAVEARLCDWLTHGEGQLEVLDIDKQPRG